MSTATGAPDVPELRLPETGAHTSHARSRVTALMPIIAILTLGVALTVANPSFIRPNSLLALVDSAAPLGVLATGATLVVLCGGIDLSIAALASLASVLLAIWLPTLGPAAVLAVIATAAVSGLIQGVVHVYFRIPSFVVTLGGMTIFSAIALLASGASTVPLIETSGTDWAFTKIFGWLPSTVVIFVVLVAVLALTMRLTPLGGWISAIGYAEPAARLAGQPISQVKIAAFTLSGATAGLAGVMLVARTYSGAPSLADSLLLPAVAAIVVGGTAITGGHGSLWRTMAGAVIVTMLRIGLSVVGVNSAFESVLYGALIIGAVAVTIDRSKVAIVK